MGCRRLAGFQSVGGPLSLCAHRPAAVILEEAFVAPLPGVEREGYLPVCIPSREDGADTDIAIEARNLTMRFGDLAVVDLWASASAEARSSACLAPVVWQDHDHENTHRPATGQ